MDASSAPQVTIPVTSLPINFKDSTLVVSPTAAVDGFEKTSYDSAVLVSELEINNPTEQLVEIPIPFPTEKYTASIAVVSKGADEFSDRVYQVTKIKGDVERLIPYLQRLGVPEPTLANKKELRKLLKGFRVGLVRLPAGTLLLRIELSQMIEPDFVADPTGRTFVFKTYAPLPSFLVAGGASMRLTATFKRTDHYPRVIEQHSSDPFGNNVGLPEPTVTTSIPGETLYHWDWKNDPVIEWKVVYS